MNSQFTGQEVDNLLSQVSGKTIYTQGSGITISETGEISCTVEGGSGGVDESVLSAYTLTENFDSATQAIAASLLSIEKLEENIKADVKNDHYTKEAADAKFVDNDELASEIVEYMKTDAYKQVHEPIEHAIAAALLHLDERVTIVEGNSIAYTAGTDISIEEGVISFTGTIPTKTSDLTNDSNYLTEHQTLKTINNQSLIGEGNITIEGGTGGGTTYTAGDGISIEEGVISVTGATVEIVNTEAPNYYTSTGNVYTAISTNASIAFKFYKTGINYPFYLSNGTDNTLLFSNGSDAVHGQLMVMETMSASSYIEVNDTKYYGGEYKLINIGPDDTLVCHLTTTDYKVITWVGASCFYTKDDIASSTSVTAAKDSQTLNLVMGDYTIVKTTQSEYDALTTKDDKTIYFIEEED